MTYDSVLYKYTIDTDIDIFPASAVSPTTPTETGTDMI